jgi:DNA polymerase III alpha subunit (gram-positive type)
MIDQEYCFYVVDTETTGLSIANDIIELSLIRLKDDQQKTWMIKPIDYSAIEAGALRVNGHKLEDITHLTKHGQETYLDANKVIVEIENWIMEDGVSAENRILIAHNITFDKVMLESLWKKCGASDSFPFGRRVLDTMITEVFLDYCQDKFAEGYSLSSVSKKYSVKNERAHSAAADTKCCADVFKKQVEFFRKVLAKQ